MRNRVYGSLLAVFMGSILTATVSLPGIAEGAAPAGGDVAFAEAAKAETIRVARTEGFSGVVLVARGNKVLLREAEGFADRTQSMPNRTDTHFPLESITKQFTAAAILLLAEEGKISLNDPISKYYAPVPNAWTRITIKQLLNHSSGIVDCRSCGEKFFDYIERTEANPLAFSPGTGMLYSNAGYGLLSIVIERATGQRYGAFIQTRIFDPLHMTHSGHDALPENSAKGYIHDVGQVDWHEGNDPHLEAHTGFGGLYSTVDDMLIWANALKGNALLSAASRTAMFTDYGHNYGFGWRFANKFGHKLVWHTGLDAYAGYASIEEEFPSEDLVVIALFNNTGLTKTKATLSVEGKSVSFPASAGRELVEGLESLYFTGQKPS